MIHVHLKLHHIKNVFCFDIHCVHVMVASKLKLSTLMYIKDSSFIISYDLLTSIHLRKISSII